MHPFEFVLFILGFILVFRLVDGWIKHKQAAREAASDDDLHKRLGELEERVRVLERIVTDERFDLKRQFRDLGT